MAKKREKKGLLGGIFDSDKDEKPSERDLTREEMTAEAEAAAEEMKRDLARARQEYLERKEAADEEATERVKELEEKVAELEEKVAAAERQATARERQLEARAKLEAYEARKAEEAKPATYTVKSGDSLSKIAKEQLGDAGRWREIYNLNRDQISDPNLIRPGQELALPKTS